MGGSFATSDKTAFHCCSHNGDLWCQSLKSVLLQLQNPEVVLLLRSLFAAEKQLLLFTSVKLQWPSANFQLQSVLALAAANVHFAAKQFRSCNCKHNTDYDGDHQ